MEARALLREGEFVSTRGCCVNTSERIWQGKARILFMNTEQLSRLERMKHLGNDYCIVNSDSL